VHSYLSLYVSAIGVGSVLYWWFVILWRGCGCSVCGFSLGGCRGCSVCGVGGIVVVVIYGGCGVLGGVYKWV